MLTQHCVRGGWSSARCPSVSLSSNLGNEVETGKDSEGGIPLVSITSASAKMLNEGSVDLKENIVM